MHDIKTFCIIGAIFTTIAGVLLHFVYGWSGQNSAVAVFSAVNESTFEHLKLLFWPMLFYSIAEYFIYGRYYDGFVTIKTISIIFGLIFIVAFFYTYTGIIGRNFAPVDIMTFVIAVFLSYFVSFVLLTKYPEFGGSPAATLISFVILILLITAFTVFTFNAPQINIFKDSVSGEYGIPKGAVTG